MKKRVFPWLITLVILLFCSSVCVVRAYSGPTISVENQSAVAGSTVKVDIKLNNNPGIAGAKITLSYDECLTLTAAEAGDAFSVLDFTMPGILENNCNFNWDSENATASNDGTLLTLTFDVSVEAEANNNANISVSYRKGDIYDSALEDVDFTVVNGFIHIVDYIPGDVNGDLTVNGKDVTLIRRFNAGGYGVVINENAADVNDDDTINGKDVTLVRRYNAGGYGVELKYHTERHTHSIQAVAVKKATCLHDGNVACWYCAGCGKYFSDENGNYEISEEMVFIKATGHTYSSEWSFDSTYHWHEMTCGCDEEENSEELIASLTGLSEEEILAVVYKDYGEHSFADGQHTCECGYTESAVLTFIDENGATLSTWEEEYGKTVSLTLMPEKLNKKFVGWYKDDVKVETYTVSGNAQFVARFVDTHFVVFVGNDNEIIEMQEVADGEDADAPNEVKNPTKTGNRFVGWENYTNITEDSVVKARFEPIRFELCVTYPDGELTQEKKIVTYGEYSESLLSAEEYWLDKNTYNLFIFTGYEFDGESKWSFADVEAEAWKQYEADTTQMPSVTVNASYNKEYALPFIVVEETASGVGTKEANLSIVMPTSASVYLYGVDMEFVCGEYLTLNSVNPDKINTSSKIYEKSSKDGESTIIHGYKKKTKTFDFEWASIDGSGIAYQGRNVLDTLYFDCQPGIVIHEKFIRADAAYFLIGESADAEDLTKISPIVIYID